MDSKTPHPLVIASILSVLFFVFFIAIAEGGENPFPTTTTTTQPDTTTTNTTQPTTTSTSIVDDNAFAILDNPAGIKEWFDPQINQVQIDEDYTDQKYKGFHNPEYTEKATPIDNGAHPQGQFRIICAPSHFGYNDPIIYPGEPGRSHLHMFFGNTKVDAFTTDFNTLLDNGGSTCQSSILNRSAYWMPALLDGNGNIVLPHVTTLYYKSHKPSEVNVFKQGTQLLAGNVGPNGLAISTNYPASERLHWGCYNPSLGASTNLTNTIPGTDPDKNGVANTPECPNGWDIQATIQFPQCMQVDEDGSPVLTSDNHLDHAHMLFNQAGNYGEQNKSCPSTHPYRVPQISYLVRWKNPQGLGEANWRLSSDHPNLNGVIEKPGMSLHADWFSAWNNNAQQAWIDGCFKASSGSRNCSLGQTGQNGTDLKFKKLEGTQLNNMFYIGPQLVDDPSS